MAQQCDTQAARCRKYRGYNPLRKFLHWLVLFALVPVLARAQSTQVISPATGGWVVAGTVELPCSGSGTGVAQTCTTSPSFTPVAGSRILYSTATANTGDITINVNSTAPVHVRKWLG